MKFSFIKLRFNTSSRGYANKKCGKYALSEMPKPAKMEAMNDG